MKPLSLCLVCFCLYDLCLADCVERHVEDVNGDGVPEVVLENRYLRLSLTTGVPSASPATGVSSAAQGTFYGNRFCWAGWLWGLTFKPTNRQWLSDYDQGPDSWHGVPECFEETVRMGKLKPGRYAIMVPGHGEGEGNGKGFRYSFRNMRHAPWTMREECLVDGKWQPATEAAGKTAGWRLSFRQKLDSAYGFAYGYDYVKTFTLLAGRSMLQCDRRLTNTGRKHLQTLWFTHGFWGQGQGGVPDEDCWTVIPTKPPQSLGASLPKTLINTDRAPWTDLCPPPYWGTITRRELAGNWSAYGNRWSGDILVNSLNQPVAFFRIWTDAHTYSCEPFVTIDLKPGETYAWQELYGVGNGLRGIKAQGVGGALDWTVNRGRDRGNIVFQVLPYVSGQGTISLRGNLRNMSGQSLPVALKSENAPYGPQQAVTMRLDIPGAWTQQIVAVELTGERTDGSTGRETLFQVNGHFRLAPREHMEPKAGKTPPLAVVLGDVSDLADPEKKEAGAASRHWQWVLKQAGFEVQRASWHCSGGLIDWGRVSLAVVTHRHLSPSLLHYLEACVSSGAGLIVAGPVSHARYADYSDLLPIQGTLGEISLADLSPRDGTREFEDIQSYRYQLSGDGSQPPLQGLPLYPESCQGIGRFQNVRLKPGARVLAWLVPGSPALGGALRYPGVISRAYGKGRVVQMTFPTLWGIPDKFVIWNCLGEHHRKFLRQLGLWTAGAVPAAMRSCVPVERLERDCYDWHRRHAEICETVRKEQYDIVMIGDSITHFWETLYGRESWQRLFRGRKVLNLGFGWDRTGNVLWRLAQGELRNQQPKICVIHIGTNNLTRTSHYAGDSAQETFQGIKAVACLVRRLCPATRIVMMKVFPRGPKHGPYQVKIDEVNRLLESWAEDNPEVLLLDIGGALRHADGTLDTSKYHVDVHLNEAGYSVWEETLDTVFKSFGL